ncbi:uncharacterized protein G2W53_031529 [Senna tora]|uniref:Uncharacterized protein n=1 Tax=Senna tora TaxID=362788 RepID=A0A834T9D8_9FABA|nr:uncharacterized protein G2W53_031529 [Senna tora]
MAGKAQTLGGFQNSSGDSIFY